MSPLDPRIPLGVQVPQIANPVEQFVQLQRLRGEVEERAAVAEERRWRAQTAAEAQREAAEKRARQAQIDDVLNRTVKVNPETGEMDVDYAALTAHLPGSLIPGVTKELQADRQSAATLRKTQLEVAEQGRKHLASAAQTIKAANYDPQLFHLHVRSAQRMGVLEPEAADRLFALTDPAQIQAVVDNFIAQASGAPAAGFTLAPGQVRYGPRGEVIATGPPAAAPAAANFTLGPGQTRYGPTGEPLASMPAAPSAPRDERIVSVIGPDGQPVYVRESQAVGKRPGAGGAAPGDAGGVKLSAAAQEDIATMLTVQQLAQDAVKLGKETNWSGTGPVQGRLGGGWGSSVTGGFGPLSGGPSGETLRNMIGNIQATIAKLRGGTSFTPNEQALLNTYTPTTADSDQKIQAKLASLSAFIEKKRANTLRVARGEYTLPETTSGAGTTTGPKVGDRRTINGQVAEWKTINGQSGWVAVK